MGLHSDKNTSRLLLVKEAMKGGKVRFQIGGALNCQPVCASTESVPARFNLITTIVTH
jgi:hypothetical protein